MYIDKLDEIVEKYHDKHYRTIKIKPADIKGDTYFNFDADKNNKNPVFKVGDHVMISKFKNTKLYTPNWSEENFAFKNVKNSVPWTMSLNISRGKKFLRLFKKRNFKS